jgi:hypothetical protein
LRDFFGGVLVRSRMLFGMGRGDGNQAAHQCERDDLMQSKRRFFCVEKRGCMWFHAGFSGQKAITTW